MTQSAFVCMHARMHVKPLIRATEVYSYRAMFVYNYTKGDQCVRNGSSDRRLLESASITDRAVCSIDYKSPLCFCKCYTLMSFPVNSIHYL